MLSGHSISTESCLTFAVRENGQTVLDKRKTGGLCHVGKPYWNGNVLLTQVVNPTAGFFAGDTLAFEVQVGDGANVLLSQPGATRIHTMGGDRLATIEQRITVGADASLDIYPDLSISQRGSSLVQKTELHLADSARCCYLEILTPGRTAHKESLEWNLLENKLDVFREGKLLARERMSLNEDENWRLKDREGKPLYLASFWIQSSAIDQIMEMCLPLIDSVQVGKTVLAEHFCVFRITTSSSVLIRKAVNQIRTELQGIDPHFGNSTALY